MKNLRLHLPHIPRFIPAWMPWVLASLTLWTGLSLLYLINFKEISVLKDDIYRAKLEAMTEPSNPDPHIFLAWVLWENGKTELALRELNIAESLNRPPLTLSGNLKQTVPGVLGVTLSPLEHLTVWEHKTDGFESQYRYWLGITESHPAYRDAFLFAAVSAYQSGMTGAARELVEKARALDPNNETVSALSQRIF